MGETENLEKYITDMFNSSQGEISEVKRKAWSKTLQKVNKDKKKILGFSNFRILFMSFSVVLAFVVVIFGGTRIMNNDGEKQPDNQIIAEERGTSTSSIQISNSSKTVSSSSEGTTNSSNEEDRNEINDEIDSIIASIVNDSETINFDSDFEQIAFDDLEI